MPNLRSTLNDLAHSFASNVLAAIRGASIQDLLAETGGAPRRGPGRPRGTSTMTTSKASRDTLPFKPAKHSGHLARRTPADIARALDAVVILVRRNKEGLRSEQIRKALRLDVREVPRILKQGLTSKKLKSKGQKRATVYSAG